MTAPTRFNQSDKANLAEFCSDYDLPKVPLRAYEELTDYTVSDGLARVLITRYRVDETFKQLRIIAKGTVLYWWKWDADEECWLPQAPMLDWDDDFKPVVHAKFNGKTFAEARESETWARDCHRPGSGRFPLDSFDRTVSGDPTTKAMDKHWGYGGLNRG